VEVTDGRATCVRSQALCLRSVKVLGTKTILVGAISTQRSVEGTARNAKNRDMQCIVVSDCCTAGELDVHEMTIKYVLPLLMCVRSTDEVITALRKP
jgi:nicotinamidase-related amidase